MKVVCKVSHINTLTYLKVYEVVNISRLIRDKIFNEGAGGYIIIDDFENKQFYSAIYFISIDENRDNKLNSIFKL